MATGREVGFFGLGQWTGGGGYDDGTEKPSASPHRTSPLADVARRVITVRIVLSGPADTRPSVAMEPLVVVSAEVARYGVAEDDDEACLEERPGGHEIRQQRRRLPGVNIARRALIKPVGVTRRPVVEVVQGGEGVGRAPRLPLGEEVRLLGVVGREVVVVFVGGGDLCGVVVSIGSGQGPRERPGKGRV